MHFGLASIKHRTNSFKVVVNIFFSVSSSSSSSSRVFMYKYLACVAFHRLTSLTRSSIVAFNLQTFSFLPQKSPLSSCCPSTWQSRLRCASVFHKQMPLRTGHLVYLCRFLKQSFALSRTLYHFFCRSFGGCLIQLLLSEMKASYFQDDRSEVELQNQDIHDQCVCI